MANPRWFMNAGDEAFSIVGKLFNKADPAADAMLRVLARRAKSAPDAEKFYDPAQELMEKVPATSWKQALDRMEEIRVQTDKDADVVMPWKWEGGRADDIPASVNENDTRPMVSQYQNARAVVSRVTTPDFIKQQRRQAKSFREKSTGEMRPAKPFSREFVRFADDTKEAYKFFKSRGASKAEQALAARARLNFALFEQLGVPREWTGEAELAAIRKVRMSAQKKIDLEIQNGAKYTPEEVKARVNYEAYRVYSYGGTTDVLYAIDLNKEKLELMTNRERAMFFELLGDWQDDYGDLADTAIALSQ
jgi:hypothetical protein